VELTANQMKSSGSKQNVVDSSTVINEKSTEINSIFLKPLKSGRGFFKLNYEPLKKIFFLEMTEDHSKFQSR
jgi:hypothetical protein